jgi:hypothetical protein
MAAVEIEGDQLVRQSGVTAGSLAYHDAHWTRRNAPLLDHMVAVIDHVQAHSRGGPADLSNLVISCSKCNLVRSNLSAKKFREREPFHTVKSKYGQPKTGTGLSSLFIMLAEKTPQTASATKRAWLRALTAAPLAPQI